MGDRKYNTKDNLGRVSSEYLCPECGQPLYVAMVFLGGEYCTTEGCENAPPGGVEFVDTSSEANVGLMEQLKRRKADLLAEMERWDQQALARALAHSRRSIFQNTVLNGYMSGKDILRIGELIQYYNQATFSDSGSEMRSPGKLIGMVDLIMDIENFLDNCDTGRYLMVRSTIMAHENNGLIPMVLKYAGAHYDDLRSSGMVNSLPQGSFDEIFTFEDIDFQDLDVEEDVKPDDMVNRLQGFLPTSFQLNRMFRHNYRTTLQYDYPWNPLAGSVIAGWWFTCEDPNLLYTETDDALAETLEEHFKKYRKSEFTGEAFVADFIDSAALVPIGIRSPNGILIDRWSLFFMLVYLYGCHVDKEYREHSGYASSLNQYATLKGPVFDAWLKDRLEEKGVEVPVINERFRADNTEYEFDLIAVDESNMKIFLIEDKFRDLPPSSITGVNLVKQEIESGTGVLATVDRHSDRANFFREHPKLFTDKLKLRQSIDEYQIEPVVVTKATPIIARVDEVLLVEVTDFLSEFDS